MRALFDRFLAHRVVAEARSRGLLLPAAIAAICVLVVLLAAASGQVQRRAPQRPARAAKPSSGDAGQAALARRLFAQTGVSPTGCSTSDCVRRDVVRMRAACGRVTVASDHRVCELEIPRMVARECSYARVSRCPAVKGRRSWGPRERVLAALSAADVLDDPHACAHVDPVARGDCAVNAAQDLLVQCSDDTLIVPSLAATCRHVVEEREIAQCPRGDRACAAQIIEAGDES